MLSEEINLCAWCYDMHGGGAKIVDYIDNPFATCERCGESAEDAGDLTAIKREGN